MRGIRSVLLGLACVTALCLPAFADERILSYLSDITVEKDGGMTVAETIRVQAQGNQIRHGIYRDFPTTYKDKYGNKSIVGFKVLSVSLDGRPEDYHLGSPDLGSNGQRVYIGRKNTELSPGTYTYKLTYHTDRQIGFFPDHDELYWNVTGNGWSFPINLADATVHLPGDAARSGQIKTEAFTGFAGDKGRDYKSYRDNNGDIAFGVTRELAPHEGLTIVVGWPKGYVQEPSATERGLWFLMDNLQIFVGLLGLALVIGYYLVTWSMVGKDPKPGTIIPLFTPPQNLSPAAMRYIRRMGFDQKAATAAILDMAVKGALKIDETKTVLDSKYRLISTGLNNDKLTDEEKQLAWTYFGSDKTLNLSQTNYMILQSGLREMQKSLKQQFEKKYFIMNTGYMIPGVVLSVVMILLAAIATLNPFAFFVVPFMCVWLTGWSVGVFAMVYTVVTSYMKALKGDTSRLVIAVPLTFFSLPFIGGEIMGLFMLAQGTSWLFVPLLLLILGTNAVFFFLMRARTVTGRKVLDQIEGFRMYLSTAEKDLLQFSHPPEKTPELFERYLPYALALDVENQWAEKFADVLAKAAESAQMHGGYTPVWYSGSSFYNFNTSFSSGFAGSFDSAISSSATAPGSSSGFSGGGSSGGSSGGGGGGGGGGGW